MKHNMTKMAVILMLIPVFACSSGASEATQAALVFSNSSFDYVALGDSYAAGQTPYGVTAGYGYTDAIAEKLEDSGVLGSYQKSGVSGFTTTDILSQLSSLRTFLYGAELVTIDIGINDIQFLPAFIAYKSKPSRENLDAAKAAAQKKMPEIATAIRQILSDIKAVNPYFDPRIYCMGYFNAYPHLPELLPVIRQLNEAIKEAAEEADAEYVETMAVVDEKLKEYLPGDTHPTVRGYRAIASVLWDAISRDLLKAVPVQSKLFDIEGHWAEEMVSHYAGKGIIAGYQDGSFQPDQAITRAEFVRVMNQFFRLTSLAEIDFVDVAEGAWYQEELQKAMEKGYISGYADHCFRADALITRQEAAVIVARLLSLKGAETADQTARFRDAGTVAFWSRDSVNALLQNGILSGYPDNSIRCRDNLTRAEALAMLDRIDAYINAEK